MVSITKVSPSNSISEQDNYTFEVQLSSAEWQCDLTVTDNDSGDYVFGSTTLTFDDTTWNIPQTVTVSGVDDQEATETRPARSSFNDTGYDR